jgi:hypothetical protein
MATYTELRELREQTFAHCVRITTALNRQIGVHGLWSDDGAHAGAVLSGLAQAVRLLDDELKAMKLQDKPPLLGS